MIESTKFSCPEETAREGQVCCEALSEALGKLLLEPEGGEARRFVGPLTHLRDLHRATLADALDFHLLRHLDDHYQSCVRLSVLREVSEALSMENKEAEATVKQLLRDAAEAASRGGVYCQVSPTRGLLGA
jgi:hypothetical protein